MSSPAERAYSKLIYLNLIYPDFQHFPVYYHFSSYCYFNCQIDNLDFHVSFLEDKVKNIASGVHSPRFHFCALKSLERNVHPCGEALTTVQKLILFYSDLEEILNSPIEFDKNKSELQLSKLYLRILNTREKILKLDLEFERVKLFDVSPLNHKPLLMYMSFQNFFPNSIN